MAPIICLATLALGPGGGAGAQGPAPHGLPHALPKGAAASVPAARPVDLNRASPAELMTLPGIGEAEARRIVESRPYKTKTDLVTKNVLTLVAYDKLKRQVIVDHRQAAARPKPKASAAGTAASRPAAAPS